LLPLPRPPSPSSLSTEPTSLQTLKTTNRHLYSRYHEDAYPLPFPAVGTKLSEEDETTSPWESRLEGSSPINLLRYITPIKMYRGEGRVEPEEDEDVEEDDGSDHLEAWEAMEKQTKYMVVSRSMVTLVRDFVSDFTPIRIDLSLLLM